MLRDTLLFDINETVLDLSPLKPKFETALGDRDLVSTWFAMLLHASTVCALTGVKTSFAELAGVNLDRLSALNSRSLSESERSEILSTFSSLAPHGDVKPALESLQSRGYRTVAFSNSSRDLIARQIGNSGLGPYFDVVLSVQDTGSFKPDTKVYEFAATQLNRQIDELRLVAAHDWDTHGAMTAGMRAAYLDRNCAPYNPLFQRPDIEAKTMIDLVEQIITADEAARTEEARSAPIE